LLAVGWAGIGSGGTAWLANPCLLVAWATLWKKPNLSLGFSLLAAVLMLGFLLVDDVISSSAPSYAKVTGYGWGYWLWLASAVALVAGNITVRMHAARAS